VTGCDWQSAADGADRWLNATLALDRGTREGEGEGEGERGKEREKEG
jgi:hypothetical protein